MGGERGSRVTLPNSIRKIEEYAFDQKLGRWRIGLHFREGVRVIEEYALRDVTGNLPSTVKIIKEGALEGWTPRNGNYTLPRDLEEIGNCCITVPRGKTIVIPASVKMIGFNAFLYEDYQTPHIVVAYGNKHFKIGKNNWLYSMDGKEVYVAWDYEDDLKIPKGVEYFLCEPVMGENESYEEIIYSESYKGNLYAEYLLNTQGEVEFEY